MNHFQKSAVLAAALALGLAGAASVAAARNVSADALKAQARVTEADARATAVRAVGGGSIQTGELEIENRKLVWSFDIKRPGSKDVVEVQVDARNGRIVSNKVETPAEQAKEAKADKASGR